MLNPTNFNQLFRLDIKYLNMKLKNENILTTVKEFCCLLVCERLKTLPLCCEKIEVVQCKKIFRDSKLILLYIYATRMVNFFPILKDISFLL